MENCVFLLLIFSVVCALAYSTPLRSGRDSEQQISDQEVEELESLRAGNRTPNNTHSVTSIVKQDEAAAEPTVATKSDDENEPQHNSRSAIFRHRGITEAKKNKYWNEKAPQVPQMNSAEVQYSPSDLATYVFNTGDEEGVAVAVEELVREGLMGRTDAINYLQDVKQILNDMREERKKIEEFRKQLLTNSLQEATMKVTTAHPAVIASTSEPKEPTVSTTVRPHFKRPAYGFTLNVIYKLAKDMFTQSILRDDPTAEETLSGLVTFLESEVGNKRISPDMKEKVLEIVSAALVDSLREYQGQSFDSLLPKVPVYRKLDPENMLQGSTSSKKPKSS